MEMHTRPHKQSTSASHHTKQDHIFPNKIPKLGKAFTSNMTRLLKLLLWTTLLLNLALPTISGKQWRAAMPYPGTIGKKDPLHSLSDDGQSKLQKNMARMKDVFDFKKRRKYNQAVEQAKMKADPNLKRKEEKHIPGTAVPFMKKRRERPRFPSLRK
jgi:hypothetical protein